MSTPSFKLSKRGKTWHATGKIPGAKSGFDIECGDGSEASARKFAAILLQRRAQLGEASRIRWRKFHAAQATSSAPSEPDDELPDEEPAEKPPAAAEMPPSSPPPGPQAPDHEKIRAKLLALGDAVEPDEVIPPGEETDEDDDPVDDETGGLVADVMAGVLVNWHTRRITKSLKAKKPPKRPGEADDRMLAWEHEGIAYNLKKLVGKAVALGPTEKMFVGMTVVTAQMYLDAEVIGGDKAEPAPAEPAPAPTEEPRGNANGVPTDAAKGSFDGKAPSLSLVKPNNPLGKF